MVKYQSANGKSVMRTKSRSFDDENGLARAHPKGAPHLVVFEESQVLPLAVPYPTGANAKLHFAANYLRTVDRPEQFASQ